MSLGKNSQFPAGLLLPADVHLRGRVFADADKSQPGLNPALLQLRNPLGQLIQELLGNGSPINKIPRGHS